MDFIISFIQTWNYSSGAAMGIAETFLIVVADGDAIIMFVGMNKLEVTCGGVIIRDGKTKNKYRLNEN